MANNSMQRTALRAAADAERYVREKSIMEDSPRIDSHSIVRHFRHYRRREPWNFCRRIAIECCIVTLAVSFILDIFGLAEREIDLSFPGLMFVGVIVAPVLETLIFQAFPVWIARLCKAGFSVQIVSAMVPFTAIHAIEGVGTAICAGLILGFYLAFTYVHWRERNRWTAFWTTAVLHAIHNSIAIPLAFALGELSEDITNHCTRPKSWRFLAGEFQRWAGRAIAGDPARGRGWMVTMISDRMLS